MFLNAYICGPFCRSSSVGRASAFQAEGREFESRLPLFLLKNKWNCRCSSGVERFLGKEEVTGSIPVIGSIAKAIKIKIKIKQ